MAALRALKRWDPVLTCCVGRRATGIHIQGARPRRGENLRAMGKSGFACCYCFPLAGLWFVKAQLCNN